MLAPDYERARLSDEAVRAFDRAHPQVPVLPRPDPTPSGEGGTGGIPDARFLEEPELALGPGFLIADITFLDAGTPDDYALEPSGRFRVQTTRFRVRLNAVARRAGEAIPDQEFDLYTERSFRLAAASGGDAPRMLAVLGDQSLRPGFNLKIAVPVSARGALVSSAYGAPAGTLLGALFAELRERAARLPRLQGGAP
jgi:hypothetical protein